MGFAAEFLLNHREAPELPLCVLSPPRTQDGSFCPRCPCRAAGAASECHLPPAFPRQRLWKQPPAPSGLRAAFLVASGSLARALHPLAASWLRVPEAAFSRKTGG